MGRTNQEKRSGDEIKGVNEGDEVIRRYLLAQKVGPAAAEAAADKVARILARFDLNRVTFRFAPSSEIDPWRVLEAVSRLKGWKGVSECVIVSHANLVTCPPGTPHHVVAQARRAALDAWIADRGTLASPARRGSWSLDWNDLDVALGWGVLMQACSNGAFTRHTIFGAVFHDTLATWLDCLVDGDAENAARFTPMLDLLAQGIVPLGRTHEEYQLLVLCA